MKLDFLQSLVDSPVTRRDFAKKVGLTAGGLVGASMLGSTLVGSALAGAQSSASSGATTAGVTDADVLNFALNLEYLEAEFYMVGGMGRTLEAAGVLPASAVSGPTTGGHAVPNLASSPIAYIAADIRKDEVSHVKFLRSALGAAAVKKPTINLNALGIGFANWELQQNLPGSSSPHSGDGSAAFRRDPHPYHRPGHQMPQGGFVRRTADHFNRVLH
jgi:hypothetical protein